LIVNLIINKDLYKILGVDKSANEKQLKRAKQRSIMRWHPDKNPENREKAEKMTIEINNAFDILSDEDKRSYYDQ